MIGKHAEDAGKRVEDAGKCTKCGTELVEMPSLFGGDFHFVMRCPQCNPSCMPKISDL